MDTNPSTPQILSEIRDPNNYPDASDERMTMTEAIICERMSWNGNTIDMVDDLIRTSVFHMLQQWGFFADTTKIKVTIEVPDMTEAVTWIDKPRNDIDFGNIAPHVLGMNAAIGSHAPNNLRIRRGGDMGMQFDIFCTHTTGEED